MSENVNLSSKVRHKTNRIHRNSMCLLRDRKVIKMFIGHDKGVHIYDCNSQKFQDVKMGDSGGIVSCLTDSDDLVFFCHGMRIYACGFNGRTLFQADTYLAVDKIEAIHVYGYQLWVVAGNMVNQFLIGGTQLGNKMSRNIPPPSQKMQDVNSYIFDVTINHSLLIKVDGDKPFLLLLKNNSMIEVADKDKKDSASLATQSPPTYGYLYPQERNSNRVLVGTMSGELMYLEVEKKRITKLWSIEENSKGRVNCIVQVKNGFMVFREGIYEMWNTNRECLGKQELKDKIQSAIYLPQQQSFFYGTSEGAVVEMFNYEKMMQMAKQRNEAAERGTIIKEIQKLREMKESLKLKLSKMGGGVKQTSNNNKKIKVSTSLALDYTKLCYSLQVSSEQPIIKIVLRGDIQMMEQKQKIIFEGKQDESTKVYSIRGEDRKMVTTYFKSVEKHKQNSQLICLVHMAVEGKLVASKQIIELKMLSMHQKTSGKLLDKTYLKANVLSVEGEYRQSLMRTWLSTIFNDFGSPDSQNNEPIQLCYQSLITKNKIYIEYRDKECHFYSESPTPLTVIKKAIFAKAKEKGLSLSYDTKTNIDGLANLLAKMAPKMKMLQQNRKQFELLPGIQELQGGELSADLKAILIRGEEIKGKYSQTQREYEELKNSICEFYTNYRTLNNWEIHPYQLDQLKKQLAKFNPERIIQLINS